MRAADVPQLVAIAPIQAPVLGRLAETYQATELGLARIVKGCGYKSGIIDPASTAEGVSPAPREEWPVLSLAASAG